MDSSGNEEITELFSDSCIHFSLEEAGNSAIKTIECMLHRGFLAAERGKDTLSLPKQTPSYYQLVQSSI